MRKPYKIPNKKENWSKSFPRDYLRTSSKGVLYGHSERSGVLYGNHIYIVSAEKGGTLYELNNMTMRREIAVLALKDGLLFFRIWRIAIFKKTCLCNTFPENPPIRRNSHTQHLTITQNWIVLLKFHDIMYPLLWDQQQC